ncbi:MAG TPA: hypothetical protein VNO70_14155 [Blastocatellia bacterium]|nr:hypothetical protein [Blastocatellia bacterium]
MNKAVTGLLKSLLTMLLSVALLSCAVASPRPANNGGQPDGGAAGADKGAAAPVKSSDSEPKLPSIYLDTTYTRPTGRRIAVPRGGSSGDIGKEFQAALNEAKPGDEIVLAAGAKFTGSFTLPAKTGDQWITIRSANLQSLPAAGSRVGPQHAAAMPKLLAAHNNTPVLKTAPGAHHYRFIGIEMSAGEGVTTVGDLVKLGEGGQGQSSLDAVPHDIIIDRCYIHGSPQLPMKRGVALNSARTAIIDSHISDVHVVGQDTQAICGWNGPGPFKIVNNYLEAAGENVMFGGARTGIPDLVPSDIEIRRNHFFKPLSWRAGDPSYAGTRWTVKNLFELKSARRVLVEGNTFENCWLDAQTGFAIVIKTSSQKSGQAWAITEDVMFINNIVRHAAGGINFLGRSEPETGNTKRVRVANNLFEDISDKWGKNMGRLFQVLDGVDYLTIEHNTCFQTRHIISAAGKVPNRGFVFTHNIVPHNTYGVKGDGVSVGIETINKYFPGSVFRKNIIAGGRSELYPPDNFFPARLEDVLSFDQTSGVHRLKDSGRFSSAGGNGKAIGCDMGALKAAIARM